MADNDATDTGFNDEFWMPQIKTPADRFQRRVQHMKGVLESTVSPKRNEALSRRADSAR